MNLGTVDLFHMSTRGKVVQKSKYLQTFFMETPSCRCFHVLWWLRQGRSRPLPCHPWPAMRHASANPRHVRLKLRKPPISISTINMRMTERDETISGRMDVHYGDSMHQTSAYHLDFHDISHNTYSVS